MAPTSLRRQAASGRPLVVGGKPQRVVLTSCHFRYNVPRIGRVKVAHGLDAVDGAFATIYGEARLAYFEVWAYQVDPQQVSLGDPIDLNKRLDGTTTVRAS